MEITTRVKEEINYPMKFLTCTRMTEGKTLSSTRLIQWDPEIQDRFSEILKHKTGQARSLNTKMPKVKPYQT